MPECWVSCGTGQEFVSARVARAGHPLRTHLARAGTPQRLPLGGMWRGRKGGVAGRGRAGTTTPPPTVAGYHTQLTTSCEPGHLRRAMRGHPCTSSSSSTVPHTCTGTSTPEACQRTSTLAGLLSEEGGGGGGGAVVEALSYLRISLVINYYQHAGVH